MIIVIHHEVSITIVENALRNMCFNCGLMHLKSLLLFLLITIENMIHTKKEFVDKYKYVFY